MMGGRKAKETIGLRRFALATVTLGFVASALLVPARPASAAPILKWERTVGAIRESSPLPVDLGGGTDVVVGSLDGSVIALRGADGSTVPGWPQRTGSPINSSAAAADTNGDGRPEIFIGSGIDYRQNGAFFSFAAGGNPRFRFQPTDEDNGNLSVHSTPAIGDVNRDGVADVTWGALGLKMWSLDQGGRVNPGWPVYTDETVFSSPALTDVNGDGQTDVVVGVDSTPGGPVDHRGGMVWALGGDGKLLWEYRTDEMLRSSPSVGDVDGDGRPEVVFGTGNYWVKRGGASDATKLFVLTADGKRKRVMDLRAQTLASPALADVNGDGRLDIAQGTWEGDEPGKVWALNGDGTNLPGYPRPSGGGIVIGGIVTADLNGDGGQDLIVPTGGGVFAYDGRNGNRLLALNEGQVAFQNSPLVGDLDANGLLDIVVAGQRAADGTGYVARYELPASAGARLGTLGWPMFRKDPRRTGSWTNPPLTQGRARPAPTTATTAAPRRAPAIRLSSTTLDFGGADIGGVPIARDVTITNTGTADLTVGVVVVEGADKGDFSKAVDGCSGKTLARNRSCTIRLEFRPTVGTRRQAIVVVPSNASREAMAVTLVGDGAAVASNDPLTRDPPILRLQPAALSAGDQVTVSGAGFVGSVEVYWGGASAASRLASAKADPTGSFRAQFMAPDTAEPGSYSVTACDEQRRCTSATVTLLAEEQASSSLPWALVVLAGAVVVLVGAWLASAAHRARAAPPPPGGPGGGDPSFPSAGRGPRSVRTGFSSEGSPEVALDDRHPLVTGRQYHFWVEIGPPVVPLEPPVDGAATGPPVLLAVALFGFDGELVVSEQADVGEVELGRDGSVRVVRHGGLSGDADGIVTAPEGPRLFFPVRTPERDGDHRLRCNIYHEQVLVQSRLVHARVQRRRRALARLVPRRTGSASASSERQQALWAELDFTLSPLLEPAHLERMSRHDLSVMMNANSEGTHGFRLFGAGGFKSSAEFDDHELQAHSEIIRRALRLAASGEEDETCPPRTYRYNGPPDVERLTADLVRFARWGFRVYDRLVERLAAGAPGTGPPDERFARLLRGSRRIQITNKAGARHVLPAAMLYDRNLDTELPDLQLCRAFSESLGDDVDLGASRCFLDDCPSDGRLDTVCPSGFWGYRHVLGMPQSVGESDDAFDAPLEICFADEPQVVMAVSTDPQLVRREEHERALRSLRADLQWRRVDSREAVLDVLAATQPHIVYFYCHGGLDKQVPFLQVGPLHDTAITGSNLRAYGIRWNQSHPLVFINGCHTTAVGPQTALEMVTAFVEREAAGVIGTEVSVFEPLACSFAEECLRRLLVDGVRIGEAVRAARLALLKAGNPLGLVYLPFVTDDLRLVQRSATSVESSVRV